MLRSWLKAVLAISVWLIPAAFAAEAPVNPQMISNLKAGGYVIFLRHAQTDPSQKDLDNVHLDNCSTQRNLTEAGREQSRQIGQAFRSLAIPVGEVLSSPYCRVKDTAQLAFGHVQLVEDLKSFENMPPMEKASRTHQLRTQLARPPKPGTNTVLVSHKYLFRKAAGIEIEEGEAAIFRPTGNGQFELVGTVRAEQWTELANSY